MAPPKKKFLPRKIPPPFAIGVLGLRRQKIRATKLRRPLFTRRAWRLYNRGRAELAVQYLDKNGRIPKLDTLAGLKEGSLVKLTDIVMARVTRPMKRGIPKSLSYLSKIAMQLPKGTQLMFLERHPKFPEWSKYCVIGGKVVWVNTAEWFDCISKMRRSRKTK